MAFYEDRVEHFGGVLVLFKRNLAVAVPNAKSHRKPAWYMRLKIGGHTGYVTKSTKLTVYEDAYEYAKSELWRLEQAAKLGHSLDEYTFEQHWQDWFDRNLKNGRWKPERQNWHEKYAARYFKPYFSHADGTSMRLNELTLQVQEGYWDWRISYWDTDRGQRLQSYNPKRRGAKTKTTNNAKSKPAVKTLQMEQSALNQIFFDAAQRGRLQRVIKLKAPVPGGRVKRRPGFDTDDYTKLTQYLRSYRDGIGAFKAVRSNAWHDLQRQQLYYFVLFLANSGLRVGEAREMLWRDIQFDAPVHGSTEAVAEVYVSKHTKKGVARKVQTQPNANMVLSRICAGPSARLGHLAFESQGAFPSQCGMSAAWVVEAVDVLEYGSFGLATRFPRPAPNQLGLDRLEEGLNGCVVIAVAFSAHRRLEPMLTQDLLVVVGAVLAAAVAVEDAAARRGSQGDGHLQRPNRQIAFHAIADGPADHAPRMQVQDHRQIQPSLAGPDVTDIACPFLVWSICCELTIQQVRRDVERVVAVCGRLEFMCPFNDDPVLAHQPPDPPMTDIDPNLLQFFGHSWPAIAA